MSNKIDDLKTYHYFVKYIDEGWKHVLSSDDINDIKKALDDDLWYNRDRVVDTGIFTGGNIKKVKTLSDKHASLIEKEKYYDEMISKLHAFLDENYNIARPGYGMLDEILKTLSYYLDKG